MGSNLKRAGWLALVSAALGAQEPVRFEVSSIREKPRDAPVSVIGASPSGSRVTIQAMSLCDLICWAYGIRPWQVAGGPPWAGIQQDRTALDAATRRFDITAKAEGDQPRSPDEFHRMMQALLAERFQLTFHREPRDTPVYVLVADKNGSKLRESAPGANGVLRMSGRGKITSTGSTIPQLINWFSNANGVDRPIVDRTDLTGHYDFTLEWSNPIASAADSTAPSIFTALPEQLGLRLEPRRVSLEWVVIDRAAIPGEN